MKKILLLSLLMLMFVMSTACSQTEAVPQSDSLSPTILGGIIVLLLGLVARITWRSTKGQLPPILRSEYVTYDKIDAAVETLLEAVGIPKMFADYVGNIIADILMRRPDGAIPVDEAMGVITEKAVNMSAASFAALFPKGTVSDHLMADTRSKATLSILNRLSLRKLLNANKFNVINNGKTTVILPTEIHREKEGVK
jgi:hypothetical protein